MTKEFDLTVFIGRMQLFHNGHLSVVHKALEKSENLVNVIGSANTPRGHRNPFSTIERIKMIEASLTKEELSRVYFGTVEDASYNDTVWAERVQTVVANTIQKIQKEKNFDIKKVALIGHKKDETSYYLKMFPQWGDHIEVEDTTGLSSTPLRQSYFSNIGHLWLADCDGHNVGDNSAQKLVPTGVKTFLEKFMKTEGYKYVQEEYEHITEYKKQWINSPYPPTFVTGDAVVEQSAHILLVKRKDMPGKGTWALPGGFINQNERIIDAVFRELDEETKIKVPEKVLRGSIIGTNVFDDPNRSARGRTITHCYHIKLPNDLSLPKVKGGDDAAVAKFWELSKIRRDMMFEDHFDLIWSMLNAANNANK
jgi:bifunctional NMN adenylyltransferase/nudix hydrolase